MTEPKSKKSSPGFTPLEFLKNFIVTERSNQKTLTGFTIIELLVAVGVLVLAAGLVLPNFNFFQRQSSLDMASQEIIGALRLAQNKALASEGNSPFGIYFEADRYTLFKGTTYYPTAPDNDTRILNSGLVLSEISLGGLNTIIFDQVTGATANSGSLKISLASDSAKNKTIYIDSSGTAALSSSLPTDEGRFKDSRHAEFTYSQNAQDANTLSLYFPASGQTENINYQTYLNNDKTAFSWEGTINVSGSDQIIKIHTHSLTLTSALFCVHRDRRYNSQALNISLDGQNLINYSATGTSTRGTSLWASEPIMQ